MTVKLVPSGFKRILSASLGVAPSRSGARPRLVACRGVQVPFFLGFVLLFVSAANGDGPALMTLRQQTRDLLREQATVAKGASHDAAIEALCDMYVVLRHDSRYPTSEMLQADATKIRRRLISVSRSRQGELKRARVPRPSELSGQVDSAITEALQATQSGQPINGERPVRNGGGAPFADEGWRLVELIERIIAPDFWERQGGPGAIRYFAMRRVLVVRATTDVHEQVKELLMALR